MSIFPRSTNKWIPQKEKIVDNKVETLYEITIKNSDTTDGLWIFVRQPSIAIFLRRVPEQDVKSINDIVACMLKCGIFFTIAVDLKMANDEFVAGTIPSIPRYPMGHVSNVLDYKWYIKQRTNHFTQNWKMCVKFLRMGGILWRIALDHLHVNLGAIMYTNLDIAQLLESKGGSEATLYTEGITREECLFTCGGIRTLNKKVFFVDRTWWPLPSTWDASGFNIGVWTESTWPESNS